MGTVEQRARTVEPGEIVELYTLDLSAQGGAPPDSPLYLHPYVDLERVTLEFQSKVYQPFPIAADGWDWNTKGTLPRPTVMVGNIDGITTALLRDYGDFVGCEVTRRRTYVEFLDTEPGADPAEEFPTDIFTVERKVEETNMRVVFELTSKFDAEGVSLPRRQILAGYCPWIYRGAECTYEGPPVQDIDGNPITATTDRGAYNAATTYAAGDYHYLMVSGVRVYYASLANGNTSPLTDSTKWVRDWCAKTVKACKARFGANEPLPFGNFPGASRVT